MVRGKETIEVGRRNGESAFDYHKRLIYGKLVDKTLADMDYTELSELVYGQPYSSDVARRMLYGSRKTLELLDQEELGSIEDDEIISKIEEKTIELKKERQKFFDQRREYNKLVSQDGRSEHLFDMLSKAATDLPNSIGSVLDGANINLIHRSARSDYEAVLVLSDWHYGMVANNAFNTYNKDICKKRVSKVIEDTAERITRYGCAKLHIIVLGDMFHGAIHTSARVASEELVCEQIMQVSEILAQAIIALSGFVEQTNVYMTYGNHGRTVQTKTDNIHRDNMERLISWWLRERFSDVDGITVEDESDNEFIVVDVCGHEMCASHGDLDSVKSSPRLLTTLFQKKYGKNIEYIILGDRHHRESFEELGVTASLCGSLCGVDDYANDKRLFSTPSQMLLIVSPRDGVDAEYRIKCE